MRSRSTPRPAGGRRASASCTLTRRRRAEAAAPSESRTPCAPFIFFFSCVVNGVSEQTLSNLRKGNLWLQGRGRHCAVTATPAATPAALARPRFPRLRDRGLAMDLNGRAFRAAAVPAEGWGGPWLTSTI